MAPPINSGYLKHYVFLLIIFGALLHQFPVFAHADTSTASAQTAAINRPMPKFNLLDGLLRFYQRYLSPQIQADCLYHPSCSRFTRKKLKEAGVIGFFVGLDQFIHCTAGMELDYPPNQRIAGKVISD